LEGKNIEELREQKEISGREEEDSKCMRLNAEDISISHWR